MFGYLSVGLLLLIAPFLISRLLKDNQDATYRSSAIISNISLLGKDRRGDGSYDYLPVLLPNGDVMITCVSNARKASLKALASINHVMVTISKPSRGEPFVSAVQWPGESKPEQSEPSNRGIYLGAGYFVLGLLGLCYTMQPSVFATVGQLGIDFCGLLMIISGFFIAGSAIPASRGAVELRLLGIKVGSGNSSIIVAAAIFTGLTIACFWQGGLCVLLGLCFALPMGMLFSMLSKSFGPWKS